MPNAYTDTSSTSFGGTVGGAGLVVGAALEVVGELARPRVVDHPRVALADRVCNNNTRPSVKATEVDS